MDTNSGSLNSSMINSRGKADVIKILLLGPVKSGKSCIANFISGINKTAVQDEYHPTVGVRIVEFEREITPPGKKSWEGTQKLKIQLWDISGDRKFEAGWPAIAHESKGVIFVISPEHRAPEKELENWFVRFVTPYGIKESSCVIFAHSTTGAIVQQKFKTKLTRGLAKVTVVNTSLDVETDTLKYEFDNLLSNILKDTVDKREDEELSIMNQN